MGKKIGFIVIAIATFILCLSVFYFSVTKRTQESENVKTLTYDSDGLPVSIHPKVREMLLKHRRNLEKIDQAHEAEMEGHNYFKAGLYREALAHYLKAHELAVGSNGDTAFLIAETYEKLEEYDKAAEILQRMINEHQYNEQGEEKARFQIKKYREMISSHTLAGSS